jgi:Ca2+-binding EF-hand superfamily protein
MKSLLVIAIVSGFLVVTIVNGSIAGHNYHGYGMKMSEMSQIDSNGDGEITFDEFSAPTVDKLKSGFRMLDTDNDDKISAEEWDEFLRVHGFEKRSDS